MEKDNKKSTDYLKAPTKSRKMKKNSGTDLRKFTKEQVKLMKPKDFISDPFSKFKIQDSKILDDLDERSTCKKCKKSRKYFCYNCYIPVEELEGKIPKLKVSL